MCSEGEEKRKAEGVHGWWGKKKKGNKKEKRNGEWKRKKKLKGKKLNWFYLYVHFVWCKV